MKMLIAVLIIALSSVSFAEEKSLCVKKDLFIPAHGVVLKAGKYEQSGSTKRTAKYSVKSSSSNSFLVDSVSVKWSRDIKICLHSGNKKPFCGYYQNPPFERCQ